MLYCSPYSSDMEVGSNGLKGNIFRPFEVNPHSISLHLTVISNSSVSFDLVNTYHQLLTLQGGTDHTFPGSESKRCNTFLAPTSPWEDGSRDRREGRRVSFCSVNQNISMFAGNYRQSSAPHSGVRTPRG